MKIMSAAAAEIAPAAGFFDADGITAGSASEDTGKPGGTFHSRLCQLSVLILALLAAKPGTGVYNTGEIRQIMGDISLSEPEIIAWLTDYLHENESNIEGKR